MRLAFFVNDVLTEIDEYTTTRLAVGACKDDHEVWYVGAGDVIYEPKGSLRAKAYRARLEDGDDLTSFLERVKHDDSCSEICLSDVDAVMLRNDSIEDLHARSWAVNAGVVFGHMLKDRGVCVVNDPIGLSRAVSKIYLEDFPERIRPRCFVSRDSDAIKRFVADTGETVLKPFYGAKGRNVFLVKDEEDPNLSQMIEAVLEDGYVFAQERVRASKEGDVRMFLLEGKPLQMDGTYAAFRRVPPENDVRANISTGGKPRAMQLGPKELAVAAAMQDTLQRDGMFFVGVDLIGDKVVEINAESPGGMQSVEHFTDIDFTPVIIRALERRAGLDRKVA